MAAFIPIAIGAGIKGITSLLGQRSANKQAQAALAEQTRQEQAQYARDKANYDNTVARRHATLGFAKAISKAHGYDIPDSAFDTLLNAPEAAFPAYTPGQGGYKPSPWLSGVLGAAGGGLEAYEMSQPVPGLGPTASRKIRSTGEFDVSEDPTERLKRLALGDDGQ